MASLPFNSLPLPPSKPRKQSASSCLNGGLKPIVVKGNPPTFVSAPGRRLVAVGDLHGDLAQARCALEMAGVLSSDGQDLWTGGEAVLIQLGDILDRGEDEIAILSLLRSLSIQAKTEGGAVFQVNGNHETMNVEGDFRYVDGGAFEECLDFMAYLNDFDDNWDEAFLSWVRVSERWKIDRKTSQSHWGPWKLMRRQKGVVARSSLLRPGGQLACELARHAVVLKVDDWVFCHGGLLPHHVAYGIERMNREVSYWMRDSSDNNDSSEIPFIATRGYDSVVWNRLYSRDPADFGYRSGQTAQVSSIVVPITSMAKITTLLYTQSRKPLQTLYFLQRRHYISTPCLPTELETHSHQICSILDETLEAVGAKAMVVGHTPQLEGVNCKYNHRIWRIDVGMSSGVLNSRPEVLELADNKARVIRNKADVFRGLDVLDYI